MRSGTVSKERTYLRLFLSIHLFSCLLLRVVKITMTKIERKRFRGNGGENKRGWLGLENKVFGPYGGSNVGGRLMTTGLPTVSRT